MVLASKIELYNLMLACMMAVLLLGATEGSSS